MNEDMDGDEEAQLERDVQAAARQGAIIAGQMGVKLPRAVTELLKVPVDWRRETDEWCADNMHGKSSLSWRSYRPQRVIDDLFFPAQYDEAMGEVIIPIDTSGSIDDKTLREFAGHIAQICEARNPSMVRVLWWDTKVHGEQVFTPGEYSEIATALKPQGGGGTRVSCVSEYINKRGLNAQAVIVLTDGWVETDIKWDINMPTLWCVTDSNDFKAPTGGRVISIKPE
jgi:predicted metal-dependent peptidase